MAIFVLTHPHPPFSPAYRQAGIKGEGARGRGKKGVMCVIGWWGKEKNDYLTYDSLIFYRR